ncbi:MAG: 2-hydroxyacid dehydrogenase [Pseudomonadota bacterium]
MSHAQVLISQTGHAVTRAGLKAQFQTAYLQDLPSLDEASRANICAIATLMNPIDQKIMDQLPNLKIIASFGVGYDHVDADAAAKKNIIVTHTPTVLDDEVADTTIGLLLNAVRELSSAERYLRSGQWVKNGSYRLTPLTLRNRKVGIYGMGRIGRAIARRLEGFGVSIAYHNRSPVPDLGYPYHATLMELASHVDTLINVVPATPQTTGAVNAPILSALGADGVLINIGRGATVNEADLAAALENGVIAAAGLDVFRDEPHVPQALLDAPNTVLLPHVGSASMHTRTAMGQLVIDNLAAWFEKGSALTPVPETAHLNDLGDVV